jgi:hypothetical protein
MSLESASDLSQVIQLVVAPVFLLAGIGAFINAFAGRLGRIVDRSRVLEAAIATCAAASRPRVEAELGLLVRRARLAYVGIALDILAALLICLLIVVAFTEHFFDLELRALIGGLFISAMLSLIGGLIAFFREVYVAVRRLSIGYSGPGCNDGAES